MSGRNGHRPRWNAVAFRQGGGFTRVMLDEAGRIFAASAVSCVWTHTARFDGWFRERWPLARIERLDEFTEAA